MKRHGFTLIELLVAAAILALLIAIVVPALTAAKAHARRVLCSTNLHQLSLGFMIYQQENNTFPYSFYKLLSGMESPSDGCAGFLSYDVRGWWWFDYLRSSVEFNREPGSIVWCPARKASGDPSVRGNILCGNYGVNRSILKDTLHQNSEFFGKPLKASEVQQPSKTLLITDSGYSQISWLAAAEISGPVFENNDRVGHFYVPGLTSNQTRGELRDNPDAIQGRHPHRTLNIGFADGHQKVRNADALMIEKIIADQNRPASLWFP